MASTSSTSAVRQSLGELIDACRDTQTSFELAARGVADETILRAELLQYSGQRQEFIAELNDVLRRAGEAPFAQPSPTSPSVRPADVDAEDFARLEQAVASHDRMAILTECVRAEAAAADAYRRVAAAGLPANANGTVIVQFNAITRVYDRMHSLLEVATDDSAAVDHK